MWVCLQKVGENFTLTFHPGLDLALLWKSNLCVALYVWQCSSILPVDFVYGQVVNRRRRRRWVVSSFLDPIVKEPFPSFLPTCEALRPHGHSASSLAAGCLWCGGGS